LARYIIPLVALPCAAAYRTRCGRLSMSRRLYRHPGGQERDSAGRCEQSI